MTEFTVTKRDGRREPRNDEKINKMLGFAEEGLTNVSASEVALKSQIHFHDGIKTEDIQATLIKTAADLISEFQPDYSLFAGRLNIIHLRKMAYGGNDVPHLYTHVQEVCRRGVYDSALVNDYNAHEWNELDSYIDHDKDFGLHYAATKQLEGKYLAQNRVTGEIFESPQMVYILIPAVLFSNYPKETRLDYIKRFYTLASDGKFSLPTPIMGGVRTPTKQFSSCMKVESFDSLDSINATASAIVKYVSQRAGIGINAGRIRALGSPIRNGAVSHTGITPFIKHFETAVKSCNQGGARGGSATLFYPLWHLEVEDLLVLKNNRGVESNRVRHLDYGVQLNKTMYQRLIDGGNITLVSPDVYDGALYDAYFADQKEFERLYTKMEADNSIRKKSIKAVELFGLLAAERAQTGRVYIQNVDHCNTHSPFNAAVAPVKQSNLCVAPETQILTDNGYQVISELEGQNVNVWNGKEWSEVEIKKTGVGQKLIRVITEDSMQSLTGYGYGFEPKYNTLWCTEYHKFYDSDGNEVRAADLKKGDSLQSFITPDESGITDGIFHTPRVVAVDDFGRIDDTYCFNEPKRHRGVFNGILTGQCLEIALPTKPLNDINDEKGEIALCTLAAMNIGTLTLEEIPEVADILIRALDALLDYQDYPVKAAKIGAMNRRALGIGVIGYAHFLAKNGLKYSDGSANDITHEWFESIQYNLLRASNNLAKEKGPCLAFGETTYSKGILPIDTYKKEVDNITDMQLMQDWESLRKDVVKYGLRNSTVTAIAPTETSSQIANETSGIEPVRGYVSVKASKDGILKQAVPGCFNLYGQYELLWDIKDNTGYIDLCAIMQKFVDQSISANTNYDPRNYDGEKVPAKLVIGDMIKAYKKGLKTLYYHNTRDGQGDNENIDDCESGACKI